LALNVVGIVCALSSEARHLGLSARRGGQLTTLADGTLVVVAGMGATAATRGARVLIEAGAMALASWGMAGGLDPTLAPGAVFLPSAVVNEEGTRATVTAEWRTRLRAAIAAHHRVADGILLTARSAVATPAGKAKLHADTGASAVDMESLAVAEVARAARVPFVAVRVIVDCAADVLPRAVTAAADQSGQLHVGRLIGELALTPKDLAPLLRLAWRYRAANRSLATLARMGSLARYAFAAATDTPSS
jgi:adenosylhomocysteine nucleosidase